MKRKKETILSVWQKRTYDVWGNSKDGYDVNDVYSCGEVEIELEVKTFIGSTDQWQSATPSDSQIRKIFGIGRIKLDTNGDDIRIHVDRARDGYPLGELLCVSHESLSPIRIKPTE